MYRFYDEGTAKYFTTGNGKMTDSTYMRKSGNTIVYDTVIQ